MSLFRVQITRVQVDIKTVMVRVENVKVVVFRQESDVSEKELADFGGSPQLLPERPGLACESALLGCKQERAGTSTERVCYSLLSHPTSCFVRFSVSLPLYRRHVLAHDPPRIAPAAPLSKQHFPRFAFDPLPCRQSAIKEIIRHRDRYAPMRKDQGRAQADSFAQRRRTWSSLVVVLPVTLPPSRPVRRVSR